MKKLFSVALTAFAFTVNAQLAEIGLKGGANFSNLKIDKSSTISDVKTENGTGFHFGLVSRINISMLYIQPELLYTNAKSSYAFEADGTKTSGNYKMHRIDVPIMAGIKFGPVAAFAGPVMNFSISSPEKVLGNDNKAATWGYQVGVGVKFFDIIGEFKYEGPFSKTASSAEIGGKVYPLNSKTSMWVLSFGYFFKNTK